MVRPFVDWIDPIGQEAPPPVEPGGCPAAFTLLTGSPERSWHVLALTTPRLSIWTRGRDLGDRTTELDPASGTAPGSSRAEESVMTLTRNGSAQSGQDEERLRR